MSSESEASAADEEGEEEEEMEGDVRVLGWQPKGAKRPLGEWEKHTTVRQTLISDNDIFNTCHFLGIWFKATG